MFVSENDDCMEIIMKINAEIKIKVDIKYRYYINHIHRQRQEHPLVFPL